MKTWIAAIAACVVATPALAGDVSVTLTGVKAKGGTVFVSLYDEKTFLRAQAPFVAEAKTPAAGDVTVTLRNVPPGAYAIGALHDADDDGRMTMGTDGRIAEGTGLSNAEKLRAMPTFAVTKVQVPASGAEFNVAMTYPEDRTGW